MTPLSFRRLGDLPTSQAGISLIREIQLDFSQGSK
jgi:hypothetical protein